MWVRFSYSQSWVSLSLTSYKLQEYKTSLKLNVQHSLRSELLAHKDYVHKHWHADFIISNSTHV